MVFLKRRRIVASTGHVMAAKSKKRKYIEGRYRGLVLVVSMFIMAIISVWSVSLFAFSNVNAQVAYNQKKANNALSAAQSGLEIATYIAAQASRGLPKTPRNTISDTEADAVWAAFCTKINTLAIGGHSVSATPTAFTDAGGSGTQIVIPPVNFTSTDVDFTVRFFRYNTDSNSLCTIGIQSTGTDHSTSASGDISRIVSMNLSITKHGEVLQYALASRGRLWITGDSTIYGNIYSSWKYQNLSPFNITSDSKVVGKIGTILTNTDDNLYAMPYDLETLAANGKPVYDVTGTPVFDSAGNRVYTVTASSASPVYDADYNIIRYEVTDLRDLAGQPVYAAEQLYDASGQPVYVPSSDIAYSTQGTKVISSTDEIQGQTEGVNYNIDYGNKDVNMPGMNIEDYDTTMYRDQPVLDTRYVPTVTEYFPHLSGNYTKPSSSSSQKVTRYKYESQTFTNKKVLASSIVSGTLKGTLFKNCVFEGILYLDCGTTGGTYNNVRFEDCTFKGPIITNTPDYANSTNWWMRNCLYFTGVEDFNNITDIPATILAPNFNVNLGNTNPDTGESNVLKGAIIGGIVDIRGNAEILGTVISMYDTSVYSSGYVSNIGATLGDGGSETTEPGDIGTITITPRPDQGLPGGIKTPIVIKPLRSSYNESI